MTNKEKYKQAFDTLSASDNFSLKEPRDIEKHSYDVTT